jgi:hypothetical protein
MHTVLTILTIILLVKLARALRWHAYHRGACGHHGPDAWRFRRRMYRKWQRHAHRFMPPFPHFDYDPYDLGAPDHDDFDHFYGRHPVTTPGATPATTIDVAQRVDEALRALELNARQSAEAGDALASVRAAVGPARYPYASEVLLALRAAGKTPFDEDLAAAALGPRLVGEAGREAREALEHLHHILTEEQRATLLRVLTTGR